MIQWNITSFNLYILLEIVQTSKNVSFYKISNEVNQSLRQLWHYDSGVKGN